MPRQPPTSYITHNNEQSFYNSPPLCRVTPFKYQAFIRDLFKSLSKTAGVWAHSATPRSFECHERSGKRMLQPAWQVPRTRQEMPLHDRGLQAGAPPADWLLQFEGLSVATTSVGEKSGLLTFKLHVLSLWNSGYDEAYGCGHRQYTTCWSAQMVTGLMMKQPSSWT